MFETLRKTWERFQAGDTDREHLDVAIKDLLETPLYVVLLGTVGDGYTFHGPFDRSAAEAYVQDKGESWEIALSWRDGEA